MPSSIEPTLQLFQVGDKLFPKVLEGIQPAEFFQRPAEANPMIWLAGHLVYARAGLCTIIGLEGEMPWPDLFGRFSKIREKTAYPSMEEIRSRWDEVGPRLEEGLASLTPEELAVPSPRRFAIPDGTIRGAITFIAYHESYHIGQMAYVRRWLGYSGLIDG